MKRLHRHRAALGVALLTLITLVSAGCSPITGPKYPDPETEQKSPENPDAG
jgi:hypothetical protein